MLKLQVYIAQDCWSCQETERIVAAVQERFSDISCELLDSSQIPLPDNVFAVPTYVLNGRVIYLGNPTPAELGQSLLMAPKSQLTK